MRLSEVVKYQGDSSTPVVLLCAQYDYKSIVELHETF